MNLSQEEIGKILKRAQRSGADFADIFVTKTLSGTVAAEDKKIEHFYRGSDEGAGIRVMKGDFSSYFYTNDLSEKSLLSLAEKAADSIGSPANGDVATYGFTVQKQPAKDAEIFDLERIGAFIREVNSYAWDQSPLLQQVTLGYGDVRKELLIANTDGVFAQDCRSRKRFYVRVIAQKNGVVQTALSTLGDIIPEFQWNTEILCAKTDETIGRVLRLLDAKPAPSGPMTVVMSSSAGGTMVHEACGHGLEADHVEKGLSVYKDRLGKKVASERIS
ncbi:MAG: TldD/PmbA family protein, partial [Bacillota bacterium]|nr:TldD/PmbA family protein [Bacillota bacterium]